MSCKGRGTSRLGRRPRPSLWHRCTWCKRTRLHPGSASPLETHTYLFFLHFFLLLCGPHPTWQQAAGPLSLQEAEGTQRAASPRQGVFWCFVFVFVCLFVCFVCSFWLVFWFVSFCLFVLLCFVLFCFCWNHGPLRALWQFPPIALAGPGQREGKVSGVCAALPHVSGQGRQHHVQVSHGHLSCLLPWSATTLSLVWVLPPL